jgi:PAS domain S-box-containing protein
MSSFPFSVPTLEQHIESLRPGDHVSVIYRGESLTLSVIVPFVRRCLDRREMCFYAIGERSEEDVAAELTRAGIDIEQARAQGALTLLTSRQYMPLEKFDPSAFIALFRARAQQALNAGFYGASFLVEMVWAVEQDLGHDALIEYETRLNTEFFPDAPAVAVCIYEPKRMSPEHLLAALRSHPLAIVDDKLISDPFYETPELLARPSASARVDWMITQLVRLAADREQLRRSHDRFRALIENTSDGITVLSSEGLILYEGPSAERLLGYKPDEIEGRHARDFISQEDVAPLLDKLRRAIEKPEELQTLRLHAHRRDGSIFDVEVTGRRLRDPADPPCIVFNWRDVSEQVRFELELERARDAALEASRLKSAFIANMSHEFRSPLNVIVGFAEVLSEHLAEQNDESQHESVEAIERACARLSRTIDNILNISKIEAGALRPDPTQLEIGSSLERLLADFRLVAERKGIALTSAIEEPGATILFDEHCLTQALTNLLDNALKFTERGAVSSRLFRASDGRLCIEVRDTGIGISREYQPRLFQPFSQELTGNTRIFQGSGLGLALTRKYLELNGAEVSAESEKGKGATFTIHFSRDSEVADQQEPQSGDEPRTVASRPGILVVEDDADTQAYMRIILRGRYDIVVAASSAEASKVLEVRPDISLILMDHALGEGDDGPTLVRHLRTEERWRKVPIIAVTAHASLEDRDRALKEGCDDYLAKPVNRRELLAKIDVFVSRPRSPASNPRG